MKATIEKTDIGYTVHIDGKQFSYESIGAATLKVSEVFLDYERGNKA